MRTTKYMLRAGAIRLIAAAAVVMLSFGPTLAKDAVPVKIDPRGGGAFTRVGQGETVVVDGEIGWRGKGGDQAKGRDFLEYDVAPGEFPANEGSIGFTVIRDNNFRRETIFTLADENYESLFNFTIYWENESITEILLDAKGPTDAAFWYATDPVFGNRLGRISLGREVPMGDKLRVLLTWGAHGEGAIYVDGEKLALKTDPRAPFTLQAGAMKKLIVGAHTSAAIPQGVWSSTRSPILRFQVYDEMLSPSSEDATAPVSVERILAEPGFGKEIKVSWTASASRDVVAYEIYRGEDGEPDLAALPIQRTGALEYSDTEVISGLTYYYTLVAVDGAGNRSLPSDAASAVAPAGEGPRITSVTVEPADKPLRPGDDITIVVNGQAGVRGRADIEGIQADVVLTEEPGSGRYVGTFPVTEAEVATARQSYRVVGKLADEYGDSSLAGPQITLVSAADLNDKTPPVIEELTHDGFRVAGFNGKLVAGDILTVSLKGEPAGYASFKLVGVSESLHMTEVRPGEYEGSYTVGFGDEGSNVAVEAVLADFAGNTVSAVSSDTVDFDTRVRLVVTARDTLLPADRETKTRVTVRAEDANGDEIEGHELALTLSTTNEYTGVVGGGKVEDRFAAKDDVDDIEVKWGGTTDNFGEIAATYTAGFAAKTALILAKDLNTGDMGAGWINTYVASTVAIELAPRSARDAADLATMRMSLTPPWLTADGRSKSRVKVWLSDLSGAPIQGATVSFTLGGENGTLKLLRGVTDATGLAEAEYRAGTLAGFVTISATAADYHVTQSMQLELRSDAPAKIDLVASALLLPADGRSTSDIRALVADINDNPNPFVPVHFSVVEGSGSVAPLKADTDEDGIVEATYTAGTTAGVAVVEARHTSRAPTDEELRRIQGTIFVPRFYEGQERDRIRILEWFADQGDDVAKGQPLVELETPEGRYTLVALEKGVLVRQVRHKRDRVELGETLGYVEIDADVYADTYEK